MKALLKRPFVMFCATFLISCAGIFYSSPKLKIAFLLLALTLLATAIFVKVFVKNDLGLPLKAIAVFTLAIILSSVLCLFSYNIKAASQIHLADGGQHRITAYIREINSSTSFSTSCNIRVTEVDGKKSSFDAVLLTEFVLDLDTLRSFSMNVTFEEPEKNQNGFPARLYYNSKGFFISALSDDVNFTTGKGVKGAAAVFKKVNAAFDDILEYNLSDEGYEIASTVLLGNRKNLSDSVKRDFSTLGVSHLLAVSGIHITIILGFWSIVFALIGLGSRKKHVLLILLALMFMGLTGFSPSVSRAGIMFVIFCIAEILGYRNDSITTLFAAVTIICVISPSAVFDVGLLLSFFATLGIVTLGVSLQIKVKPDERKAKRVLQYVLNSFSVTLSATVFTLPVMWIFFGYVSVASPISNLLYIPLVNTILLLSPLVIATSKIPFLCDFFSFLVSKISELTLLLSKQAKYLKNLKINLEYDFVFYIFIVFILLLAVVILMRKKSKLLYFAPVLVFALAFTACLSFYNISEKGTVELLYIKNKKNESFVLKDGDITFVDMSTGGVGNIRIAKNEIGAKLYETNIDNYMLTHYHKLHISTFIMMCDNFYIDKLIIPEPVTASDSEIFTMLCESALEKNINIIMYEHDFIGTVTLKNATFDLMEHSSIKRSTHPLISMRINANGRSVAYFGASSYESDSDFIANIINSDMLIFGVHGPVYKNTFDTMNTAKNASAIYSSEEANSFINAVSKESLILYGDSETVLIKIPPK